MPSENEQTTSEQNRDKTIEGIDLAYELIPRQLLEYVRDPDIVKAVADHAHVDYASGFGLVTHYAAAVFGLYQLADSSADPYDRVSGGAGFAGNAAEIMHGLLEALPEADSVSSMGVAGAAGATAAVLGWAGLYLEEFKLLGRPFQQAAENVKEYGRDMGERLGFTAGILALDRAWVNEHLLSVFLHPLAGEDEFGQMQREETVLAFRESYREAQAMPPAAKQAYLTCVADVVSREHFVATPRLDYFDQVVDAYAHASNLAQGACEGVANAIAPHRDELARPFDMVAQAAAGAVNIEADAAAVFTMAQDAAPAAGHPPLQGHEEHAGPGSGSEEHPGNQAAGPGSAAAGQAPESAGHGGTVHAGGADPGHPISPAAAADPALAQPGSDSGHPAPPASPGTGAYGGVGLSDARPGEPQAGVGLSDLPVSHPDGLVGLSDHAAHVIDPAGVPAAAGSQNPLLVALQHAVAGLDPFSPGGHHDVGLSDYVSAGPAGQPAGAEVPPPDPAHAQPASEAAHHGQHETADPGGMP